MRCRMVRGAVLVLSLTACETANVATGVMEPRHVEEMRMVQHDTSFHLSATERAQIRRGFDVDALERLLASVPTTRREEILSAFRIPTGNKTEELWYIGDPGLQELLEAVWAPYWDRVPLAQIDKDDSGRPGKRLARERRIKGSINQ